MAANIDVTAFEPMAFHAVGDNVFVHVRIAYDVKKTGKKVDEEQIHWWTCEGNGKVSRLQHYEDTAQVLAAVT
jgi:ketosteroid isomerase-like protein